MEITSNILQGLEGAFTLINILMVIGGVFFGTIIGVFHSINPTNGIALILPVIYILKLPPENVLIILTTIYYSTAYTKRISGNIPKNQSRTLNQIKSGKKAAYNAKIASKLLSYSVISALIGGTIALVGFMAIKTFLVEVISQFGPSEYVAFIAFAFVLMIVSLRTELTKNLVGLCLGLLLSVIGLDPATGVLRYSFGIPALYDGVDFIIVVIGIFTISDVLMMMTSLEIRWEPLQNVRASFKEILSVWGFRWLVLRTSIIGFIVSFLPGVGIDIPGLIASWTNKKSAIGHPTEKSGPEKNVLITETSASTISLGSLIPLFALGIPGSAATAVLMGAMIMMNITPGAMFYNAQSSLIWILIISLFIMNFLLLFCNGFIVKCFNVSLLIPKWIIAPVLVVISVVGVYAIHQSLLSLFFMLVLGVFAYCLRKSDYSIVPLIFGYMLGKPFEVYLRRALAMSGGGFDTLVQSTFSQVLWCIIIGLIFLKLAKNWRSN